LKKISTNDWAEQWPWNKRSALPCGNNRIAIIGIFAVHRAELFVLRADPATAIVRAKVSNFGGIWHAVIIALNNANWMA
jgi:hypothetical protein